MAFRRWRRHFEQNALRPFPRAEDFSQGFESDLLPLLLSSLARFQAGETSEGRLAHQIDQLVAPYADEDFRACIKLFVREEARHARILGELVRALGGGPAPMDHWTRKTFVITRRLIGVRTKLFVALSAEIVGRVFYDLLHQALPPGDVQMQIRELAEDEGDHLQFHGEIWRNVGIPQPLFDAALYASSGAALTLCAVDHWRTLRAVNIGPRDLFRGFVSATGELAEAVAAAPTGTRALVEAPSLTI